MTPKSGYETAHTRIRRARSKAAAHLCIKCNTRADDWAYNHGEPDPDAVTDDRGRVYSNDPSFYMPMCRPCHRTYDLLHSKPDCPKGHPYEGANLYISVVGYRVCRSCHAERARNRRKTPESKAKERERSRRRHAARRDAA